jgi:DNA polymerase III subunit gamma/tau
MALDTKYRPLKYSDVLGQGATETVLREFIRSDSGFHQSYLFCGPHGSGKTTLGRIAARGLLCEDPQGGEPCDECSSCRSILEKGTSECFSEMDAATKSGKDNILRITTELEYSTFSGKRRIYLFDEAHQLSRQALDALLKPMEEFVPGSDDKQMVCIFCTTEPDKMRDTVFSRCAPAFSIRVVPPNLIAERLAWICDQEGIEYDTDALITLAEVTESHIRDAIKGVEAVSKLGKVTQETLNRYLRLDINVTLLEILALIGSDVGRAMTLADNVCQVVSPTTAYDRLTKAAMLAYRVNLKAAKAPSYWNPTLVARVGDLHKDFLVLFAHRLASRPGRPTPSMLALDIAHLHQARSGVYPTGPAQAPPSSTPSSTPPVETDSTPEVTANGTSAAVGETPGPAPGNVEGDSEEENPPDTDAPRGAYETSGGIYVDPRGVRKTEDEQSSRDAGPVPTLGPPHFSEVLSARVSEMRMDGKNRGPAG